MQSVPRLEIKNLTRRFGDTDVVRDVSLSVMPGQVTCLLGPSGCGKSTTLRMIAGIDQQNSGEIWVDGKLICDTHTSVPPEERSIGLMFQDFALFPHLSVAENVAFGLSGSKAQKRARVVELLEKVGLAHMIDEFPHTLSGGEQQRVALARALAPRPSIMLMDEPFSGLDNRLRDDIRDETLALLKAEDTAVVLVTHEPDEAMRMADEIALMRAGQIVQRGAPYNIITHPLINALLPFSRTSMRCARPSKDRLPIRPLVNFWHLGSRMDHRWILCFAHSMCALISTGQGAAQIQQPAKVLLHGPLWNARVFWAVIA